MIARLRARPATAQTPIVVITGKDLSPEDRKLVSGQIAELIRKGDLLMSDIESRLRETLTEPGLRPSDGENIAG